MNQEETIVKTANMGHGMPPYKRALISLLYTGYQVSDRLNEQLKPFGLSEQQLNVLHIIKKQNEQPCNLCNIQEQMMHKMSNATRLVEKLRLKGLVTRDVCEDNRRRVEICITEKGLALMDAIEKKLNKYHFELGTKLTDKEYTQLADLLDKMRG
ncbi:MAG TPA: MarR family transcriptional regulator [Puia sp.]|nr:MarR family transcriptional regulator [Puia sp.]